MNKPNRSDDKYWGASTTSFDSVTFIQDLEIYISQLNGDDVTTEVEVKDFSEREIAIMNEAFMTGRIYATGGEKESPAEIYAKMTIRCKRAADVATPKQS